MYISVHLECYRTSVFSATMHLAVFPYVADSMTFYGTSSFRDSSAFDTACEGPFSYFLEVWLYENPPQDARCKEIEMARNPHCNHFLFYLSCWICILF